MRLPSPHSCPPRVAPRVMGPSSGFPVQTWPPIPGYHLVRAAAPSYVEKPGLTQGRRGTGRHRGDWTAGSRAGTVACAAQHLGPACESGKDKRKSSSHRAREGTARSRERGEMRQSPGLLLHPGFARLPCSSLRRTRTPLAAGHLTLRVESGGLWAGSSRLKEKIGVPGWLRR